MVQTTLENYTRTDVSLYDALKSCGYVDNHKLQILSALWDLETHNSDEIAKLGGKQYNARILELRRDGWKIINFRSGLKSFFKLENRDRRW